MSAVLDRRRPGREPILGFAPRALTTAGTYVAAFSASGYDDSWIGTAPRWGIPLW